MSVTCRRRRTRARLGAATALLTIGPVLAGCGAGLNAQTGREYGPVDAATASVNGLRIQNAFVAPPSGEAHAAGADAALYFTVVNRSDDDRLTQVRSAQARSVNLAQPVPVPRNTLVNVGAPPYTATLQGLGSTLRPGQQIDVTLTFERAGEVRLGVPVELKEGPLATSSPIVPPTGGVAPSVEPRLGTATPNSATTGAPGVKGPTPPPAPPPS